MDSLVKQQIKLVEAANATPYGWNIAKHLEAGHGIFSERDKANTKALRESKVSVRRDNKEFKARKNTKKSGKTRLNTALPPKMATAQNRRKNSWHARHMGTPAQGVAAK